MEAKTKEIVEISYFKINIQLNMYTISGMKTYESIYKDVQVL